MDAALNNYVALNYASRHMSWLHCMWGVGTSVGPYIMEYALTGGQGWNAGYRYIALIDFPRHRRRCRCRWGQRAAWH